MHALLDHPQIDYDILMLQDPWWGPVGQTPSIHDADLRPFHTVSSPQWHCFVPVTPQKREGPSVVTYVRKGLPWLKADVSSAPLPTHSILALDVSIYGYKTRLTNIYLHGHRATQGLADLTDHPLDLVTPNIIVGDFNLHHELWSPSDYNIPRASKNAQTLADWIISHELELANTPETITRLGKKGQRDSIIDLTILNRAAWSIDLVTQWECERALSYGSDHNGIVFSVSVPDKHSTTRAPTAWRYSIDASRESKWLEAFEKRIDALPPPDTYRTESDCQDGALAILNAMSLATQAVMPRTSVDGKPPRAGWWDDKCTEAADEVHNPFLDPEEKKAALGRFRTQYRRARNGGGDKICREITTDKVHRLTNWYSGKKQTRLPPIQYQDRLVTEPAEKAQAFKEAFFPQIPPEVNATDHMGVSPKETRDHSPLTEEEIRAALDSSSNTSAPGAFGSNYRVLKWAFEFKPALLTNLYNACLHLGYHPKCLRNAVVSIIPKANRSDMSRTGSYRPISLLETLSKCLEKVMTTRILFEVGKHRLVPMSQFGGRDASSCTDAGLSMVHDIQSLWRNKRAPSLLTLDIKGYFNNINHARLLATMTRLGFSLETVTWLGSYLSDRSVQIKFDGYISGQFTIAPVGVPQGSPLSPILSTIYTLPLLLALSGHRNFLIKGYVDDFTILAHSDSYVTNVPILEGAVDLASEWLSRLGLAFELEKCELIHFAAQPKHMISNPDLFLRTPSGASSVVRAQNTIRWLGFHLDRRLDFKDHVEKMAKKALGVIAGLRLLANSVRGLSTKHARLLYKSCVIPVLTYGSAIWYTGVRQTGLIQILSKAQNTGLRWLLGVFKTTSVTAMEHLASIPPMPYTLRRLSENLATRLRKMPPHSEVARRLPTTWDSHDPETPQPLRPNTGKPTIVHRLANLSHPDSEFAIPYLAPPWERPHPWGTRLICTAPPPSCTRDEKKAAITLAKRLAIQASRDPKSLAVFTDGSKRTVRGCRKVGAGYSIVHQEQELVAGRRSLGPRSDIYDAEMFALALAAHHAVHTAPPSVRKISFFSDNQASISTITDLKPHPAQAASIIFRRAIDSFLEADASRSVEVLWVPGHAGIQGNERADRLANQASSLTPEPFFNRTVTWARAKSKEQVVKDWTKSWNRSRHSEHVLRTIPYLPRWKLHPIHDQFPSSRATHARLFQVITGHCFAGVYALRFRPGDDPTCPCDPDTLQTITHVLTECPLHSSARKYMRNASPFLLQSDLFGTFAGLRATVSFLEKSSAFRPRS